MKHLLFTLLFAMACFGQEKMHVTAYRMAHMDTDAPCSIAMHVTERQSHAGFLNFTYVSDESNDQQLIKNLLDIKDRAPGWKSKPYFCHAGHTGGDSIDHMMVIESPAGTDTLFSNYSNRWIIFPADDIAFYDSEGLLKKALTGNMKAFFEYDFFKQITAIFDTKDSVSAGKITYKETTASDYLAAFRKNPAKFSLVGRNAIATGIDELYVSKNDTIQLENDRSLLLLSNPKSGWAIDGIYPGDPESRLFKKYPLSTQIPTYYHARFEDIKRMYYYIVHLENGAGEIMYMVKDKKISQIRIELYPS